MNKKKFTIDDILPEVKKYSNKDLRELEDKFWDETWNKKHITNNALGTYLVYMNYIRNCERYNIPYRARQKELIHGWYNKHKGENNG